MPFDDVGRLEIYNRLPNETLTIMLKFHINDYFSHRRHLNECPPSSLQVCRRWRQLAISNPSCWSHINVYIREWPKMKSAKQIVSPEDTKSRAMQDTLIRYFEWAKDYPVNLFIEFDYKFAGGDKQNLMHWIRSSMPRLCSYREEKRYRPGGLFLHVLPSLSEDRYSGLTDLAIVSTSGARYRIVQRILMPKLRVLRLMDRNPKYYGDLINNHLDLPNLKALYIEVARPKLIIAALERFPLLTELAVESIRIKKMEFGDKTITYRPKANNLRRVMLEGFSYTMRNLQNIWPWFEEVIDWTLNSSLVGDVQFAKGFKIGSAEMLTIHCHQGGTSELIQLYDFWRYFSNVIHLTLVGGGKPTFTFTEEDSDNDNTVKMKWSIMERLIESVTLVSGINYSPRYWPRLRSLEVRNLTLSLDDLTLLLDTLKQRSSAASDMNGLENGDSGFRLTIKRSKYSYGENSLHIDKQGMSYSVFKSLVDELKEKTQQARLQPLRGVHQLWDRLVVEWNAIPPEVCQNLIESMPRSIAAVIKSEGGPTKY